MRKILGFVFLLVGFVAIDIPAFLGLSASILAYGPMMEIETAMAISFVFVLLAGAVIWTGAWLMLRQRN